MTVITPDRFLRALQQTPVILNGILHGVTQEQAATLRDPNPSASGGAGWTTTEVVCHLRDFETIFYERALLLLKEDRPEIPTFDADQLAVEGDYNNQNMRNALHAFHEARQKQVALFSEFTQQEWNRTGLHHRFGVITLLDHAVHVATHDVSHLEQITRILGRASG